MGKEEEKKDAATSTTPPVEKVDGSPAPDTKTSTTKPEKKEETVEVGKDTLSTLVKGYEEMKKEVADLTSAANLGRLERVKAARDKGELVKTAKVSLWQGNMILGWESMKDDVYVDERGRVIEDQQIRLLVDQGEGKDPEYTEAMPYKMFARLSEKRLGEVIKESKNQDGSVEFTLKFDDGREVTLPIVFLN
jgi:hypothetical protein